MFSKRNIFLSAILLTTLAVPLASQQGLDCFAVLVGRECTADGSTMLAHNEDDSGPAVLRHWRLKARKPARGTMIKLVNGGTLAAAAHQHAVLWSQMLPTYHFSDYYLNEHGLVVCSNACQSREDRPELTDGGIGFMLRRLVALRAATAAEGIEVAIGLVKRFGYYARGRTLLIADPTEAWLLCLVGGKHFAAVKVPADRVCVLANAFPIRDEIRFNDPRWRLSKGLKEYAQKRNWYHPETDKTFDFAKVFSNKNNLTNPNNTYRQFSGINLLAAKKISNLKPGQDPKLPLFIRPGKKLAPADLMGVLRDYGDKFGRRYICCDSTRLACVFQLRPQLPPALGALVWKAFGRPDNSCFIPWYVGIKTIPAGFNLETPATGLAAVLAGKKWHPVQSAAIATFYQASRSTKTKQIRNTAIRLERSWLAQQRDIEAAALRLHEKNPAQARDFLTAYTMGQTEIARRAMSEIIGQN